MPLAINGFPASRPPGFQAFMLPSLQAFQPPSLPALANQYSVTIFGKFPADFCRFPHLLGNDLSYKLLKLNEKPCHHKMV